VVVVPEVELVPPQFVVFEVLKKAVMYLGAYDPRIIACTLPAVLDYSCRRLVDICLRSKGQPPVALEGCPECLLDLVVFGLRVIRMNRIVCRAGPDRQFTGAPGGFVFGMRDWKKLGRRFEFGEIGVDRVEVEVDPGQSGLIDNVGADEEIFWVFNSAFDESGYGVIFDEELVRSRTAWSASVGDRRG
jgi:hypothetical protein